MDPRVAPLASILDPNTDLLLNCPDGLDGAEARRRLPAGGNSVAFLAAHLTDSRHSLVARIGRPLDNPLAGVLADARGIEDVRVWLPLDEIRRAWLAVSDHLATALDALPTAELERASAHRFPVEDPTLLGMIAFLAQHDSYHVGQAAFLRRQLGKRSMAYTRGRRAPAGTAQPQR